LSGIELFDSAGNPITTFTIQSDSGTQYSANGVVPEPGSAALVALGAVGLCAFGFRRRKSRSRDLTCSLGAAVGT
jgi:hypothetical protein